VRLDALATGPETGYALDASGDAFVADVSIRAGVDPSTRGCACPVVVDVLSENGADGDVRDGLRCVLDTGPHTTAFAW